VRGVGIVREGERKRWRGGEREGERRERGRGRKVP